MNLVYEVFLWCFFFFFLNWGSVFLCFSFFLLGECGCVGRSAHLHLAWAGVSSMKLWGSRVAGGSQSYSCSWLRAPNPQSTQNMALCKMSESGWVSQISRQMSEGGFALRSHVFVFVVVVFSLCVLFCRDCMSRACFHKPNQVQRRDSAQCKTCQLKCTHVK